MEKRKQEANGRITGLKLRVRELEVYLSYLDDIGKYYFLDEEDLQEIDDLVR